MDAEGGGSGGAYAVAAIVGCRLNNRHKPAREEPAEERAWCGRQAGGSKLQSAGGRGTRSASMILNSVPQRLQVWNKAFRSKPAAICSLEAGSDKPSLSSREGHESAFPQL